jgi:hypothetical protein
MAFSILFTNLYELHLGGSLDHPHAFSLMLIIPFIGTTLALLRHNWCGACCPHHPLPPPPSPNCVMCM